MIPLPVTTSARRWNTLGLLRVTAVNQLVVCGYMCGVPAGAYTPPLLTST